MDSQSFCRPFRSSGRSGREPLPYVWMKVGSAVSDCCVLGSPCIVNTGSEALAHSFFPCEGSEKGCFDGMVAGSSASLSFALAAFARCDGCVGNTCSCESVSASLTLGQKSILLLICAHAHGQRKILQCSQILPQLAYCMPMLVA